MILSAIVLTSNSSNVLPACLSSLAFCDEIIVIDDDSSDASRKIARRHGARVYKHALKDFASQRNYGLAKARGEWILYIDADERVPEKLAHEIQTCIMK